MTALWLWENKPLPHSKDAGYGVTIKSRKKILGILSLVTSINHLLKDKKKKSAGCTGLSIVFHDVFFLSTKIHCLDYYSHRVNIKVKIRWFLSPHYSFPKLFSYSIASFFYINLRISLSLYIKCCLERSDIFTILNLSICEHSMLSIDLNLLWFTFINSYNFQDLHPMCFVGFIPKYFI
jgi:hypothetical protein